jgi:transposase
MRKGYNGLAGIVRERLGADPMPQDLFLFCNRNKNHLKVLVCDESGMWILAKRLDCGTFAWPAAEDTTVRVEYRPEQVALLLNGFDTNGLRARPWKRRPRKGN